MVPADIETTGIGCSERGCPVVVVVVGVGDGLSDVSWVGATVGSRLRISSRRRNADLGLTESESVEESETSDTGEAAIRDVQSGRSSRRGGACQFLYGKGAAQQRRYEYP